MIRNSFRASRMIQSVRRELRDHVNTGKLVGDATRIGRRTDCSLVEYTIVHTMMIKCTQIKKTLTEQSDKKTNRPHIKIRPPCIRQSQGTYIGNRFVHRTLTVIL